MTDPLAQLEAYKAALLAAGIRATYDPRDSNPPAVMLRPPSLDFRFGRGCTGATWEARLMLPDTGPAPALRSALPLLTAIQDALAPAGVALLTATPADFQLADGATAVGYVLTWTTH